jgi:hypothetical protein
MRDPLWRQIFALLHAVLGTHRDDAATVRMTALILVLAASTTMVVLSVGILLLADK